ncbi:MAG: HmuY family protein [Gemmatimonadota bacterium]
MASPSRATLVAAGAGVVLVAGSMLAVASSLDRGRVPEFAPTVRRPQSLPPDLVEDTITVDARQSDSWVHVDLSRRAVVDAGDARWDLAVRRFRIRTRGLATDPSPVVARVAEETAFERVAEAPPSGYLASAVTPRGDTVTAAFEDWYAYRFWSHLLVPRSRTWIIRTADDLYAKVEILSYYCPGAVAGCLTFRYAVQGDGSRRLSSPRP